MQDNLELAVNEKDDFTTVPVLALIVDLYSPSSKEIPVFETIKKLYKLANTGMRSDRQLILPKVILASDHAFKEDFQYYWNSKGIEHLI